MCKIFAVAGLNAESAPKAMALLKRATPALTANDKDGFGYSTFARETGLWVERWLTPKYAWRLRNGPQVSKRLNGMITPLTSLHSTVGREPKEETITSLIAHSRMATCGVSMSNTHPFVGKTDIGKFALIHNGVVYGNLDLRGSDNCDSVGILNEYLRRDVPSFPANIAEVAEHLSGSFACAVLAHAKQDVPPYMDIFRNSGSQLHAIEVEDIGIVFCTSDTIVCDAAVSLGFNILNIATVDTGRLIRLDAVSGEVLTTATFQGDHYHSRNDKNWANWLGDVRPGRKTSNSTNEKDEEARWADWWDRLSDEQQGAVGNNAAVIDASGRVVIGDLGNFTEEDAEEKTPVTRIFARSESADLELVEKALSLQLGLDKKQ